MPARSQIGGRPERFHSPHHARALGIAVIHQEFNLVPGLSAVENIFLGQEIARWGFLRARRSTAGPSKLFSLLGSPIDLDVPAASSATAQQQLVEIAKALAFDARILRDGRAQRRA